jgi:hypothetical protein
LGIAQRAERFGYFVKMKHRVVRGYIRLILKRDDPSQRFVAVGQGERATGFYSLQDTVKLEAHFVSGDASAAGGLLRCLHNVDYYVSRQQIKPRLRYGGGTGANERFPLASAVA